MANLKELAGKNRTIEALDILDENAEKQDDKLTVMVLKGQLHELQHRRMQNSISDEEYFRESARINHATLQMADIIGDKQIKRASHLTKKSGEQDITFELRRLSLRLVILLGKLETLAFKQEDQIGNLARFAKKLPKGDYRKHIIKFSTEIKRIIEEIETALVNSDEKMIKKYSEKVEQLTIEINSMLIA